MGGAVLYWRPQDAASRSTKANEKALIDRANVLERRDAKTQAVLLSRRQDGKRSLSDAGGSFHPPTFRFRTIASCLNSRGCLDSERSWRQQFLRARGAMARRLQAAKLRGNAYAEHIDFRAAERVNDFETVGERIY